VGLSTGWALGKGWGRLGVTILACWGTALLAGGGLGASAIGFGGGGVLGKAFFGLNFFGLGFAVACAFCAAACLACAKTEDQTLSEINRQSANWSSGLAISVNLIFGLLFLHLFISRHK
jgi:hypothetical protein